VGYNSSRIPAGIEVTIIVVMGREKEKLQLRLLVAFRFPLTW
jgi:hypothetical protein